MRGLVNDIQTIDTNWEMFDRVSMRCGSHVNELVDFAAEILLEDVTRGGFLSESQRLCALSVLKDQPIGDFTSEGRVPIFGSEWTTLSQNQPYCIIFFMNEVYDIGIVKWKTRSKKQHSNFNAKYFRSHLTCYCFCLFNSNCLKIKCVRDLQSIYLENE